MCRHKSLLAEILTNKVKFSWATGYPIGRERMCDEKIRTLSRIYQIEFGLVYRTGSRVVKGKLKRAENGRGGNYLLYAGTYDQVWVRVDDNHMFITHTHPNGNAKASTDDMTLMSYATKLGSNQIVSSVIPLPGAMFHFTATEERLEP
jgi:hypothetical protein